MSSVHLHESREHALGTSYRNRQTDTHTLTYYSVHNIKRVRFI